MKKLLPPTPLLLGIVCGCHPDRTIRLPRRTGKRVKILALSVAFDADLGLPAVLLCPAGAGLFKSN